MGISKRAEIAVAADADAEVRRITLTNHGVLPRMLDVTSYAEVSLNSRRADQAHPAFAKLFLETVPARAPNSVVPPAAARADQKPIWALHFLAGPRESDTAVGVVESRPIGPDFWAGAVLPASPACSGFRSALWEPSGRPRPCFQPAPCPAGSEHIRGPCVRNRTGRRPQRGGGARPQVQQSGRSRAHVPTVENAQSGDSGRARHLARRRRVVPAAGRSCSFHRAALRSRESVIGNRLGQSGLWPYTISGDLPIVLSHSSLGRSKLARELIRAHAYWRRSGLVVDLVLLHDAESG